MGSSWKFDIMGISPVGGGGLVLFFLNLMLIVHLGTSEEYKEGVWCMSYLFFLKCTFCLKLNSSKGSAEVGLGCESFTLIWTIFKSLLICYNNVSVFLLSWP